MSVDVEYYRQLAKEDGQLGRQTCYEILDEVVHLRIGIMRLRERLAKAAATLADYKAEIELRGGQIERLNALRLAGTDELVDIKKQLAKAKGG